RETDPERPEPVLARHARRDPGQLPGQFDYASESLPQFTNRVYRVLTATPELPGQLARIAPRMATQDWLGSYRDFATLPRVVNAMRHRLSRPQLLDGAEDELARLYDELWADFREFYPQLMRFADGQRNP